MGSLVRPIAGRAVHLRITPRPSNLGESREVMRLISGFGEVEYFRSLKYDALPAPHTSIVIYKTEKAAQECLKRSPIRFRMGRAQKRQVAEEPVQGEEGQPNPPPPKATSEAPLPPGPVGTPFGLGVMSQTRSMSTQQHIPLPRPPRDESGHRTRMPFEAQPQLSEISESRIFQIQAHPSSRHFRDLINVGHYHGTFAIDSKMPGQGDLAKKVPTPGLSCCDWKAVDRPWHVVQFERKREKTSPKPRRRLGELWEERRRDGTQEVEEVETKEGEKEHLDDAIEKGVRYDPGFGLP